MRNELTLLCAACAGTLLLACANVGPPQPAVALATAPLARATYEQARAHHLAGRPELARAAYLDVLVREPAHVDARNGLATLHAEQGDFDEAIALWEPLTASAAQGPESAFLFRNLGFAYFLHGDYKAALTALEKACVLDPLNHRAWQHLGQALDKLGQAERAQLMYQQARTLERHDFKVDYSAAQGSTVTAIDTAVHAPEQARVELATPPDSVLLEIRNGNGVIGMAAATARELKEPQLRVVRLSNQKGFTVQQTRVEYQGMYRAAAERLAQRFGDATLQEVDNCKAADLRLVIGHDLLAAKIKKAARLGAANGEKRGITAS